MLKFLNKSYPFNDDLRHNAKIIFFISIGVLVFLVLFQPIDLSSYSNKDIFYLITGLGASTFLTLSLNLIVLPSFFPRIFLQNKWNIKKEILWNIWILFLISASNFLFYSKLFEVIDISFGLIGKILLLAFLPVAALIIINQDRLLRNNLKTAMRLNNKLKESKQLKDKMIFFDSEYKKDSLSIKLDSLILIKTADNYIEVFYKSNEEVKSQMIRSTLAKAEQLFIEHDFIFRCHRTFIVNKNYIEEISGSSQGYKLSFSNIDFPVLVSQKYINEFKKMI
ncbi:MAG: LytTR family transcriptional regulator [Bacteroidales bacterium]|nr:LytTR family transcriptional regulator [Bacteroidales bacterium]